MQFVVSLGRITLICPISKFLLGILERLESLRALNSSGLECELFSDFIALTSIESLKATCIKLKSSSLEIS